MSTSSNVPQHTQHTQPAQPAKGDMAALLVVQRAQLDALLTIKSLLWVLVIIPLTVLLGYAIVQLAR